MANPRPVDSGRGFLFKAKLLLKLNRGRTRMGLDKEVTCEGIWGKKFTS